MKKMIINTNTKVITFFKMSELKQNLKPGMLVSINNYWKNKSVLNAEVTKVQTNGFYYYNPNLINFDGTSGGVVFCPFQAAKNTVFHKNGIIDYLIGDKQAPKLTPHQIKTELDSNIWLQLSFKYNDYM